MGSVVHELADGPKRSLGRQTTFGDDEDARTEALHFVEHVAREHHAAAGHRGNAPDEVGEMEALAGVEPVQRLVEHEHLGIVGEREGDLDPLAHAFAVGAHIAAVRRIEIDEVQRVRRALARLIDLRQGGHRRHQLERGHALEQRLLLRYQADQPQELEVASRVASEHAHLALARSSETDQESQHGRLAGSVRAEQGGDARSDAEGHVGDRHHVAEPLRDRVERHDRNDRRREACHFASIRR